MPEESHDPEQASPKVDTAFITVQLQQLSESYRVVITQTVQIMTVLVLANVTLAGYAIGNHIAGILLIGPLFPIGMVGVVLINARLALPLIYAFINLERKYGHDQADWLGKTFFSFIINPRFVQRALEIGDMPEWSERFSQLRKMPIPIAGTGRGFGRACLALIALAQ